MASRTSANTKLRRSIKSGRRSRLSAQSKSGSPSFFRNARLAAPPAQSPESDINGILFRHMPATLVVSNSGKVLFINTAFERLLAPLRACGALSLANGRARWLAPGSNNLGSTRGKLHLRVGNALQSYLWQVAPDTIDQLPVQIVRLFDQANDEDPIVRQKLERLDDLTRLVSDWIWETDDRHELTYLSPRIMEVLGYHPREIKGRPLSALATSGGTALSDRLEKGTREPFRDQEVTMTDRSGRPRAFRLSGLPIYLPDSGRFAGFRGTAQDVTALRAREKALVTAKESAELANRSKSEFLANISHELRTPLNAVIGFSEIMLGELLGPLGNPQYSGYARDIHDSAEHLLKLINDILDVAKIEAGEHRIDLEKVCPKDIVHSVCRIMRNKAQLAGHRLMIDLPKNLPLIEADERKIKQVLLNLLSNAIKFTPRGGAIRLSARREDDGGLSFVVTDNGIGIAPEDMSRAFAPFQQIDSRLSRQFEGTGLGLPLSAGFMKLHGGELTLESQLQVGTTAIAKLPNHCICPNDASPSPALAC